LGGGGNGAIANGAVGDGVANTGGGGGGRRSLGYTGGAGGSGIVIIRYLSTEVGADGSGGTITHAGGYTIHTFTAGGNFTAPTALTQRAQVIMF
jgi:hypothetical protein